jgi:hypothetical protein
MANGKDRRLREGGRYRGANSASAPGGDGADLGYDAGLLRDGALADATDAELVSHARAVAEVIPLCGLLPSAGGWRTTIVLSVLAPVPGDRQVVAIKVAPFNRYATSTLCGPWPNRAGRATCSTPATTTTSWPTWLPAFPVRTTAGGVVTIRMTGGLLGHWAFWTREAVRLHFRGPVSRHRKRGAHSSRSCGLARETTDANAAVFDAANDFKGCIPESTKY